MCSVKILKEAILGDILSDVRPGSHCKFCCDPPERGTANKTAVDRQGNILTSVTMSTSPQVRPKKKKIICLLYSDQPIKIAITQ